LRIGAALAVTLVTLVADEGEARAGDVEVARSIFAEGVKLYQRDDYEGARRLFKRAEAEHHAAPIVYNIGLAEERLGHPQAAVDAYEAYVAETGDSAEFSAAAVVAIAQIKSRSTRLRIETKPPGARVFVDALTLPEASPTTVLVAPGHHVVLAQGDGWRTEQDVEAKGAGDALTVTLGPPAGSDPAAPPPDRVAIVPVPEEAKPDRFIWGASFALAPYHLQGARQPGAPNAAGATLAMAGAILEAGHAVTDRFEFLARGFVALGPEGKPTYAFMGGPAVSLRLGSHLWLGATFIGGQIEGRAHDKTYSTGLVFGAMAEASLVLASTPFGQWTVGIHPGLLLTEERDDNTAYLVPLSFGYRSF
jgi:tetratricopeptide (TPR) repeat protein